MATGPVQLQQTVKLGDDFELDLQLRELRRRGDVVKLERIPVEILILLVENSGQIITRQQIVERVWGPNFALDTDNSINSAIRKIRRAFRDHPEQPRFVQTVTGTGYRLIAPVTFPDPAEPSEPPQPESNIQETRASTLMLRHWLPVAVIALFLATAFLRYFERHNSPNQTVPQIGKVKLAVLPFENLTGSPGQEYLTEGFTEEIITQLGSVNPQGLAVIARSSVMHYEHRQTPLDQVARDLGVQYILEGSIRRGSGSLRITAQLVRTKDQTQMWAHDYDREERDLVTLQTEIAQEITDEIHLALTSGGRRRPLEQPAKLSPQSTQAFDWYLKGRYFWGRRTAHGFEQAVRCFQRSVALDPGQARAYAGLADSYAMMSSYGLVPAEEFMPKARAAALRALELDEHLAEAHTSLAVIAEIYNWDWKTAEGEYRRAIELNPSYATAHQWYAEMLGFQGRFKEAMAESEQARQLDPFSLIIAADNGAILYYSRQYDSAIERFQEVLKLDPSVDRAALIIEARVEKGQFKEALKEIESWRRIDDGPWILAWKTYVYGRAGDSARARQCLQDLRRDLRSSDADPAQFLAMAYAGLNDRTDLMACLQKAYQDHSNVMTSLKADPIYDPFRNDPWFQALMHRVGLAQ